MTLSIIVPIYNVERYLSMCLDSVVQQSLLDYEVILIDDGSPDSSGAICDNYASRYPQIRVIHQSNHGLSASRNTGISEAKGKYVLFLDSDDFLVPESLPKLLQLADDNELDVLGFRFVDVPCECKEFPEKLKDLSEQIEVMSGYDYIATNNYVAQVWGYIIRRELIVDNDIKFPVGHMLEDAAFNVRVFSKARKIAQVPVVVYCYRYRPESAMHNHDKDHQKSLLWDYLYAANDVGKAISSMSHEMNEDCYNRCASRRDSYVFFGAIRAFKLGMVEEYISSAKEQKLYPFKRMNKKDYPSFKHSIIYWCISHPWLWKTQSSLYRLFKI